MHIHNTLIWTLAWFLLIYRIKIVNGSDSSGLRGQATPSPDAELNSNPLNPPNPQDFVNEPVINNQQPSHPPSKPPAQVQPPKSTNQSSKDQNPSTSTPNSSQNGKSHSTPVKPANQTVSNQNTEPPKELIELDIKKARASTNDFDYEKKDHTATYTAKDNHAFTSVKHSDKEIWSTTDPAEYSTKVTASVGTKEKALTIHMPDDSKKVFARPGQNKEWFETDEKSLLKRLDSKDHPKEIKISTPDSVNFTHIKENDTTQYIVKQNPSNPDEFYYQLDDESFCSSIKLNDVELWQYDTVKKDEKYPEHLTYNKSTSKFIIKFSDRSLTYVKDSKDNWTKVEIKLEPIHLDLSTNKESTNKFEYKHESASGVNTSTYTAKDGYGFSLVKDESCEIWGTEKKEEFANKVEFQDFSERKALIIHLVDGMTKIFRKNWNEAAAKNTGDKNNSNDNSPSGTTPIPHRCIPSTHHHLSTFSVHRPLICIS